MCRVSTVIIIVNYLIIMVAALVVAKTKNSFESITFNIDDLICKQIIKLTNLSNKEIQKRVMEFLSLVIITKHGRDMLKISEFKTETQHNVNVSEQLVEKEWDNGLNELRQRATVIWKHLRIIAQRHPIETFVTAQKRLKKLRDSPIYDLNKQKNWQESGQDTITEEIITETEKKYASKKLIDLKNSLKSANKLVILIHGWNSHSNGKSITSIAMELLKISGVMVVAVEARELLTMDYFKATAYVPFIADELGKILAELSEDIGSDNIHLIGHSLGSHIAGVTGNVFKAITGSELGRITGLDPAKPCYTDGSHGLAKGNAKFVDVIHTNAGILGVMEAVGDADFYPNGGAFQPGCFFLSFACYHVKSWEFFAKSINNQSFEAVQCSSLKSYLCGACAKNDQANMGYHCSPATGTYYLTTNALK